MRVKENTAHLALSTQFSAHIPSQCGSPQVDLLNRRHMQKTRGCREEGQPGSQGFTHDEL